jgi:TolB protein
MHPYLAWPDEPRTAASTLIALDVALGLGDFYDIGALFSDELASADFYYRLLNAGFRMPASGGTDNFSDVWRDPPPGSARTFARIEGELTVQSWLDALRSGRTFMSTGPLLLLEVEGQEPGDELRLDADAPTAVRVRVEAMSIAALDSLQIIVNGRPVRTISAPDARRVAFEGPVPMPDGGWIAARVLGPASDYHGDDYAFAHTSPIYVVRGGQPWTSAVDARFLAETVDAIRTRVESADWRTPGERERFLAAVDSAKAVYDRIASSAAN